MANLQLKNTHILVDVNPKGAEISQLRNLYATREVLWQVDLNYWNRTAPLLFPIVGKLRNDEYSFEGKNYQMKQHGFARDAEFDILEKTETTVHMRLVSNEDTRLQFPFDFQLDVKYFIENNKLKAENIIANTGEKTLPFSFGAHPGFSIQLPTETCSIVVHRQGKELEKTEVMQRHIIENGLYTGEKEPVTLINGEILLNESYFRQDAIVFKNEGITGMSLVQNNELIARLDAPTAPYWGIWKKQGAPFVCIEPWWGIADHLNSNSLLSEKEGIHWLAKNEVYSINYTLST